MGSLAILRSLPLLLLVCGIGFAAPLRGMAPAAALLASGLVLSVEAVPSSPFYSIDETALIVASVTRLGTVVTDASVYFTLATPSGETRGPLPLHDDGNDGDAEAGDGDYTATIDLMPDNVTGPYRLAVYAERDGVRASDSARFVVYASVGRGCVRLDDDLEAKVTWAGFTQQFALGGRVYLFVNLSFDTEERRMLDYAAFHVLTERGEIHEADSVRWCYRDHVTGWGSGRVFLADLLGGQLLFDLPSGATPILLGIETSELGPHPVSSHGIIIDCGGSPTGPESCPEIGSDGSTPLIGGVGTSFDAARDSNGCLWIAFVDDDSESDIVVAKQSTGGGWDLGTVCATPSRKEGVALMVDSSGGIRIIFLEKRGDPGSDLRLVSSNDGGQTWSEPVRITADPRVDPTIEGLFEDSSGRFWAAWYGVRAPASVHPAYWVTGPHFEVSEDFGGSWGPEWIPSRTNLLEDFGVTNPRLFEDSTGRMWLGYTRRGPLWLGPVNSMISEDLGSTWSIPRIVLPYHSPEFSTGIVFLLLAATWTFGHLGSTGSRRRGLAFLVCLLLLGMLRSAWAVSTEGTGVSFLVDGEGRLWMCWHARDVDVLRGSQAYGKVVLESSYDGGETWHLAGCLDIEEPRFNGMLLEGEGDSVWVLWRDSGGWLRYVEIDTSDLPEPLPRDVIYENRTKHSLTFDLGTDGSVEVSHAIAVERSAEEYAVSVVYPYPIDSESLSVTDRRGAETSYNLTQSKPDSMLSIRGNRRLVNLDVGFEISRRAPSRIKATFCTRAPVLDDYAREASISISLPPSYTVLDYSPGQALLSSEPDNGTRISWMHGDPGTEYQVTYRTGEARYGPTMLVTILAAVLILLGLLRQRNRDSEARV